MQNLVRSLGLEIPWRREWQPTLVFFPGEFHGQRSLAGNSSWDQKVKHINCKYMFTKAHTWMFLAALFVIAKNWKQSTFSIIWWIDYSKCICTVEYCSTIKRSEESTDNNAAWMKLDNVMLSERSQTQKVTYCVIPFMWNV